MGNWGLIICAMFLTGGASARLVAGFDRKTPCLPFIIWSGLEIIALACMFKYYCVGV